MARIRSNRRREIEPEEAGPVRGPARTDRRTKDLVERLERGDVAIIDHADLDRIAAEALADAGVTAVLNAAESCTGRYPNQGPLVLLEAGIRLVDGLGPDIMTAVPEAGEVVVEGADVLYEDEVIASGVEQSIESIEEIHDRSRANLGAEFERFVDNTVEYLDSNLDLLADDLDIPDVGVDFTDRHVLVVVRGHDYREDLALIGSSGYITEMRPILVGVDGGADALLDMRLTPDVIIGDFDSLSQRAWNCGADLIHHVHPDGRAPGREELAEQGLPYQEFVIEGTSEDAAMMLMYEHRAELIVAVGTHATMVEFLDKGRAGMSSTFLTRLRLGPMLIDAKGVSELYHGRVRRRDLFMLVASAIIVILVVAIVSDSLQLLLRAVWVDLRDLWYSMTGRLT